ncbi:tRNA (5-methylaminomethyl-2-thiouridine)(34)-methyltransferase MnmD [Maricaulis sp. CAU 1757]
MSESPSLVCAPARLDWSQTSGPRAVDYGDVYFSAEDGLAETRAVFLEGCGLPQAWAGRRHFTVGELGFGTGLNALALWQAWREHRPPGGWLDLVSVEKHPLRRDEAARAFAAWPELAPLSERLLAQWPPRFKGAHRMVFPEDGFAITLMQDEAEAALGQVEARADAWFLDGFAPALNGAMWSHGVFDAMARRSAPGARVGTFTVAGAVRRGLQAAGFAVEKKPGFGRKRERLEAVFSKAAQTRKARTPERVAVVGAGIAGASLVRALAARGVEVDWLDQKGLAAGASGAPAGLLTPRLERADRPHVRATLAAYAFARSLYGALEGFHASGAQRRARDDREAARFEALAEMLGEGFAWRDGALHMASAGWFEPERLVRAVANGLDPRRAHVVAVDQHPDGVVLRDADGLVVAEADHVVHAGGHGAAAFYGDLEPSAGQLAVFAGTPPEQPVSWGQYACPAPDGVLIGATHVRGEVAGAMEQAIAGFRSDVASALPGLALGEVLETWSGVRATTADRLPVLGECGAGQSVLGGFGARGFAHAPLLAEALVAELFGQAGALERDGRASLDAGRFEARRRRRSGG